MTTKTFYPATMKSAQAAEYLGVSVTTLRRMVKRGTVPCFRPAGHLRFERKSLDDFKTRRTVVAG